MDLNSAMHTARCGGKVRDDATMRLEWAVIFVPKDDKQSRRPPLERDGLMFYVNPQGEKAHKLIITDAMRASFQWKTVP